MKIHHAVLLMIFFTIVGNIIYLYPKLDDSPVPSGWGTSIDWGRHYILRKGHIYEKGEETALTWQSNTMSYGNADVLPKIYFAIINIVTGTTTFPSDLHLHYFLPWIGTLVLPIMGLFWYGHLSKKKKGVNRLDYCLLFL